MDSNILLFFSLSCLCLYFLKCCYSNQGKLSKLPPGPKPWPIIGNIFQLSDKPHHSLANLSKIYGPVMTLKLGSVTTVVVSSVDLAREVFQNHDLSFSSRVLPDAARVMNHHNNSILWLPVSSQWRNLRKISAVQLFTKARLDASQLLRQKKVRELLEYVKECSSNCQAVEIGKAAFTTSLNLLSETFFSIDLASHGSESSQEFKDLACTIIEALARPNLADLFPILSHFDLHGIKRDAEKQVHKFFAVFDDIIKQRLSASPSPLPAKDDFLETLLNISKEDGSDLSVDGIKHLLLDLIIGGTETTTSTLEWAMTELLRNPETMAKAQAELDDIIGKDGVFQESDIGRLPYLQAVVKETLRLHPPAPLLFPHKAVNDVGFCGYIVPRNSKLLLNVWAIGRDPYTWPNPAIFSPERFLESQIDVKGKNFELIPFGAGRRICPGLPLAYRMLHVMLVTLLHSFNWKLEDGLREEDVDMTEKLGLTLQKAKPLLAVPVAK